MKSAIEILESLSEICSDDNFEILSEEIRTKGTAHLDPEFVRLFERKMFDSLAKGYENYARWEK